MVRRRRRDVPTLSDYTLVEKTAFLHGWAPGRGRGRWRSWSEYLADFSQLRVELLARFPSRTADRPMFADSALAYRRQHGAAALDGAGYDSIRATPPC